MDTNRHKWRGDKGRGWLRPFAHSPIRPLVACLLLVLTTAAFSQEAIDTTETWDAAGDLGGWSGSNTKATLSNPGGSLQMQFKNQSLPASESCIARMDIAPGDILTNISFSFLAVDIAPSAVRLYVHGTSGKAWYLNLARPEAGPQVQFNAQVVYDAGWTIGPAGTLEQFNSDMKSVDWVGVYVRRGGIVQPHSFQIDNFSIQGYGPGIDSDGDGIPDSWEVANWLNPADASDAEADSDGDSMTNYEEYRAGTNPNDPNSEFTLALEEPSDESTEGIVVKWNSVAFRTYAILRSTNLLTGFNPLFIGIPATPPVNTYIDHTATGSGPYFYKVEVESGQ